MVFFFFKQKTAYELRISDWSSDVCSSDLLASGPDAVAVMGIAPAELAVERLGIGVHQQLVRVEPVAGLRIVGAMHAVAVEHVRLPVRPVAMPDLVRLLRQGDPFRLLEAGPVEQAELHPPGVGGEEGEVAALTAPACAPRDGAAGGLGGGRVG